MLEELAATELLKKIQNTPLLESMGGWLEDYIEEFVDDEDGDSDYWVFYYAQGEITFDEHFELAENEYLVIDGNLTVNGTFISHYINDNDYSLTTISGDLHCQHLLTGSPITVLGNITVEGVIYGISKGGLDALRSHDIKALALLDNGQYCKSSGQVAIKHIFANPEFNYLCYPVEHIREAKPEDFIEPNMINGDFFNYDLLLTLMKANRPILTNP